MRNILGFLFDILTEQLGLPTDPLSEFLIMSIISALAGGVAYWTVGAFYDNGDLHTKTGGSIIHWVLRAIIFVVLWEVVYGILWFLVLVKTHYNLTIIILCSISFVMIIIRLVLNLNTKGTKNDYLQRNKRNIKQ